MANATVYLKCDRNVEVQSPDVYMADVGNLRCADPVVAAKLKALKIHHFGKEDAKRCVISVLKLIGLMEDASPGVTVQIVGETDVLPHTSGRLSVFTFPWISSGRRGTLGQT